MPRGDGTGPMGMGPMTGRAAGRCAGNGAYVRRPARAGGYGCRRMYYENGLPRWARYQEETPAAEEKEFLAAETKRLESRLSQLRERMDSLDINAQESSKEN